MMAILVCLGVTREAPRPTVIEVACPPAAILYVDDHRVRQMGPARRLTTPPLPPGEICKRRRWRRTIMASTLAGCTPAPRRRRA
jgi:hypothetical protein